MSLGTGGIYTVVATKHKFLIHVNTKYTSIFEVYQVLVSRLLGRQNMKPRK
jgi:hypothetical protein